MVTRLHKIGAKEIKLEHYGICSADTTDDEKEILFHATTSFMKGDMQRMLSEVDPNDPNAPCVFGLPRGALFGDGGGRGFQ